MTDPIRARAASAEVGVVGFGYYTTTVLDLLADAGTPAAFAVDDRNGDDDDRFGVRYALAARGIPILTADEFAQRTANGGVELYAGRVECPFPLNADTDPYRQIADWLARVVPALPPLRHPAALVGKRPPAPCPNRYAVFGYPGSGNVLTQNLIGGLFARRTDPPSSEWVMRAALPEHHFYSTVTRLQAAFAPLSPTHVDFIPHEFGTMIVSVEAGDRAAVAFGVPSPRHLGLPVFNTHSRPTRTAVDYFASADAPCVAVVRHPCETLLSLANKTARPARTMLDHLRFLERIAEQLADWTEHLLENRDRVRVVRYEDMAERNVGELKSLAGWLGFDIDDSVAGELFDAYLNRNLPSSVPTHFFRGGSDKWRAEFEPRDLRTVLRWIPAEAFTAFGYDVPTEADLAPAPSPATPRPPHPLHACLLEAFPLHPVPGANGIVVNATDEELAAAVVAAFRDPSVRAVLRAAA